MLAKMSEIEDSFEQQDSDVIEPTDENLASASSYAHMCCSVLQKLRQQCWLAYVTDCTGILGYMLERCDDALQCRMTNMRTT